MKIRREKLEPEIVRPNGRRPAPPPSPSQETRAIDGYVLIAGLAIAMGGVFLLWGIGWTLLLLGLATMAVAIVW